jgi:hypothetical protein
MSLFRPLSKSGVRPLSRNLIRGQSVFSPLSIPDIALWFDMSDASTLFDATSGGSLAAADAVVKRVEDKSPNGWHLTQATTGNSPTRKAALIKGKDCLRFDGDDYLFRTTGQLSLIERTVFVVFRENSSKDYAGIFVSLPTPAFNDYDNATGFELDTGTSGQQFAVSGATGISYVMSAGTTNPAPLAIYAERKTAGSGQLLINGSVLATDSSFTEFNALSNGGVCIGARYLAAFAPAYGINGDICEVIYFSRRLSDSEMTLIHNYLSNKWIS